MRVINMLKYHIYPNIVNFTLGFLPNSKETNKIRGKLFSPLFKNAGRNIQIASGVIINMHRKIEIGDNVYIAHNVWMNGTGGLRLEDGVIISPNVIIATTKHLREDNQVSNYKSTHKAIKIGRGTWIAGNSTITMGVEIGKGSIVSANSLVNKTLAKEKQLIGGVPAKIIKPLGETDV